MKSLVRCMSRMFNMSNSIRQKYDFFLTNYWMGQIAGHESVRRILHSWRKIGWPEENRERLSWKLLFFALPSGLQWRCHQGFRWSLMLSQRTFFVGLWFSIDILPHWGRLLCTNQSAIRFLHTFNSYQTVPCPYFFQEWKVFAGFWPSGYITQTFPCPPDDGKS